MGKPKGADKPVRVTDQISLGVLGKNSGVRGLQLVLSIRQYQGKFASGVRANENAKTGPACDEEELIS